jgi:hypothetical protein
VEFTRRDDPGSAPKPHALRSCPLEASDGAFPYGDTYPTTSEGRLVAVFLMAAGVGVFGILSGLAASWFLSPAVEETENEVTRIEKRLVSIQQHLEVMARTSTNS